MSGAPDWIRTSVCRFRRSVPLRSIHWSMDVLKLANKRKLAHDWSNFCSQIGNPR
jgi:hypothetical protein